MNKKLLSVVLSGVLCVSLLTGCAKTDKVIEDDETDTKVIQPADNEDNNVQPDNNTVELPETEEPGDEVQETPSSDVDTVYDILKPEVDKAFSGMRYELIKDTDTIILFIDLPYEELVNTSEADWNGMVESCVWSCEQWNTALEAQGTNVRLSMIVGDMDLERGYLVVDRNSQVTYNVFTDPNSYDNSTYNENSL